MDCRKAGLQKGVSPDMYGEILGDARSIAPGSHNRASISLAEKSQKLDYSSDKALIVLIFSIKIQVMGAPHFVDKTGTAFASRASGHLKGQPWLPENRLPTPP
jgi:hypothetical protein